MRQQLIGLGAAALLGAFAGQAGAHTYWTSSSGDFVWPCSGKVTATWYYRSGGLHGGIDLAGAYGQVIIAARSGYARDVNYGGYSYGRLVIVSHSSGYQTYYGHNSAYAHTGYVTRGTRIAYEGQSGNATGPHCHFEIRRYGSRLHVPGYLYSYKTRGYPIPYNYSGI